MTSLQRSILKTISGNKCITPGTDGRYRLTNPQGADSIFPKTATPAIQSLIVHGHLVKDEDIKIKTHFIKSKKE
jgi:hypothetical protein